MESGRGFRVLAVPVVCRAVTVERGAFGHSVPVAARVAGAGFSLLSNRHRSRLGLFPRVTLRELFRFRLRAE